MTHPKETEMAELTMDRLRAFTLDPATVELRRRVRRAEAIAVAEAEYVAPIHDRLLAEADLRDDDGERIIDVERLYLCEDEEGVAAFYAAVDAAHAANGRELEPGYCPKLVAENELIEAERALRDAACRELGIPEPVKLEHVRRLDQLLLDVPEGR